MDGDDCCHTKSAFLRAYTSNNTKDIVYASFKNEDFFCPFHVRLEHDRKKVVIAIRYSFSLTDFVVDVICEAVPMDIPGLPSHFKVPGSFQEAWIHNSYS
jgi:hypothetical protein